MKYILYGCADCLDDNGDVITFAVQSGGNIQNGVITPITCPICQGSTRLDTSSIMLYWRH